MGSRLPPHPFPGLEMDQDRTADGSGYDGGAWPPPAAAVDEINEEEYEDAVDEGTGAEEGGGFADLMDQVGNVFASRPCGRAIESVLLPAVVPFRVENVFPVFIYAPHGGCRAAAS